MFFSDIIVYYTAFVFVVIIVFYNVFCSPPFKVGLFDFLQIPSSSPSPSSSSSPPPPPPQTSPFSYTRQPNPQVAPVSPMTPMTPLTQPIPDSQIPRWLQSPMIPSHWWGSFEAK